MSGLDRARDLGAREHGLAVVVTRRADGSPAVSVVNAGVLDHPVTGEPIVGFVARGGVKKLANLRRDPLVTVLFRSGWEWVAVEGEAGLAGPEDLLEGLDPGELTRLVRRVYAAAAGGTEDEWSELDATFEAEGHTAVLVLPTRIYTNPE